MILEYVYDLPGTGCQLWVKIYCEFAADPNNPLSGRLSDGCVNVLPPGGG